MREPDLDDPRLKIFEAYPTVPQAVPLDITAETVEKVASHLSGAASPSGTDAVDLSNWLPHHGAESQMLRTELAAMARWIANDHPPWAAYRALMACRLVALDKELGTRPVGQSGHHCLRQPQPLCRPTGRHRRRHSRHRRRGCRTCRAADSSGAANGGAAANGYPGLHVRWGAGTGQGRHHTGHSPC
jgi:hypothetical protein